MITLKLSNYTTQDLLDLQEIILNSAIEARITYGDTRPVKDLENALIFLSKEIQSTEPGLRNPASK